MKSALRKSAFREIRSTLSRFLSIFGIVALGVGFFSGVKASAPDMRITFDDFMDENHLLDLRIVSTYGFNENDIAAVSAMNGAEVYPSYFTDLISHFDDRPAAAARLFALNDAVLDNRINGLVLTEGRMPENEHECVMSASLMKGEPAVGSTVVFTDNYGEAPDDALSVNEYTIVGKVRSPMYIDKTTRGSTSVGNGSIEGAYYISEENFLFDYYTELYVRFPELDKFICYSSEYKDASDARSDEAEKIGEVRCPERFAEIKDEANEKLSDAESELRDSEAEYDEKIADAEKKIADGEKEIADGEKELADGEAEIAENEQKLADGEKEIAENEQKLIDAEKEIAENEQKLKDAEKEIAENEQKLIDAEKEIAENEQKLTDGEKEIAENRKKLADAEKQYEAGLAEYNDGVEQYKAGLEEYEKNTALLEEKRAELEEAKRRYEEGAAALEAAKAELSAQEKQIEAAKMQIAAALGLGRITDDMLRQYAAADPRAAQIVASMDMLESAKNELAANETALEEAKKQIDDGEAQLSDGEKQLEQAKTLLDDTKIQLEDAEKQLADAAAEIESGRKQLEDAEAEAADGRKQLEEAKAEIADGRKQLDDAKAETADGRKQLDDAKAGIVDGRQQIEDAKKEAAEGREKLSDARKEAEDGRKKLEDARKELADGKKELADAKAEGEEKLADAHRKLDEAREDVEELEEPKWYVFTRDGDPGYTEYGQNADRINNIASVFPVFFIIVAMLVCLTTMSRMIEEQRVGIGTLKALGYENGNIIFKYMFYALSAAFLGCVVGCGAGMILFPYVIMTAYGIMYDMPALYLGIDIVTAVTASAVFLAAIALTVWLTARSALGEQAAQLMRPKAPKNGKRIFLEHIAPVWKRFGFSSKVTARNLFRYKRKMLMTVVGIAGCTALLLTGLALYDAINDILSKQFGDIQNYQGILAFDADKYPDSADKAAGVIADCGGDTIRVYQKQTDIHANGKSVSAYITVPSEPDKFTGFFDLRSRTTGDRFGLSGDNIYIDEKSSLLLGGIGAGSTVEIDTDDADRISLTVTAPFENYPNHYIYMTPEYYESLFGEGPAYNVLYFRHPLGTGDEQDKLGEKLLAIDGVLNVTFNSVTLQSFTRMLDSLSLVIMVIIASAGMLAFVVMYNLTNINITERIREIATLKVLGFYDGEVDKYIFRENIILSLIGTGFGLILGIFLARFVITTAEVDIVMFGRNIYPLSFVLAAVITIVFSVLVTLAMHRRLQKVNMIEALKSVE